jgi:hypothetical protein
MEKNETLDLSQFESPEAKARRLVTRIMCICYAQEDIRGINTSKNICKILETTLHFLPNENSKFDKSPVVNIGWLNQYPINEVKGSSEDSLEIGEVTLNVTGI